MGSWGYHQHPFEPPDRSDYLYPYESEEECEFWEEWADRASEIEFAEREMSYEDAVYEDIATDEGGWGAWMGGEL